MKLRATAACGSTIALLAALALPAAAAAETLVPPGNSAVDQYTETYPTGGGNRDTRERGEAGDRSPAQMLGPRKARRLEARGEAGRATAALVAATTPRSPAAATGGGGQARSGGTGGGGESSTGPASPGGSSGLGEILGQATGLSSSGGPGALLPLAILATALWALAYFWRRKRSTT